MKVLGALLSLALASSAQAQSLKAGRNPLARNASSVGVMASVVRYDFVINEMSTASARTRPQHQPRSQGQALAWQHATKVKDANEINRRLMALSEEDRRSVFRRILALAKERCVEITRTFYQQQAKQWNVWCRGGPTYVIEVEPPKAHEGN